MDDQQLGVGQDVAYWHCKWKIEKRDGDWADVLQKAQDHLAPAPNEVVEGEGNILVYRGISNLWQGLIGGLTATVDQVNTYYDNTNAHIGVGDSTTAAAATQTDLQAGANKLRKAMDATYPTHTAGATSASNKITFRATFATGDANFAWEEFGVFNSDTAAGMLNRKVQGLGTKVSTATWTFTVEITLS